MAAGLGSSVSTVGVVDGYSPVSCSSSFGSRYMMLSRCEQYSRLYLAV